MKRIIMLSMCCGCILGCMTKKDNLAEDTILEDCFGKKSPLLTRTEIIAPVPADVDLEIYRKTNRSLLYSEIDLTGDGRKDIIIETLVDPAQGYSWSVYLCVNTNQYRKLPLGMNGFLAIEELESGSKRIWEGGHINCGRGTIRYWCFEHGNEGKMSPVLEICNGDGGSEMGNNISNVIFNEKNYLPLRIISPASATSDLPYRDMPYLFP